MEDALIDDRKLLFPKLPFLEREVGGWCGSLLLLVRSPSAVVAAAAMADRDGGEFAAAADRAPNPSLIVRTACCVGGGKQSTSLFDIPDEMLGLCIVIVLFF